MNNYDSLDFVEALLRHLYRSDAVLKKAKELKMESDDLLSSADGIQVYKILANVAFNIGQAPIDRNIVRSLVNVGIQGGIVPSQLMDPINRLLDYIYNEDPLMEEYFLRELPQFIVYRRSEKIIKASDNDIKKIVSDYEKLIVPLQVEQDIPDIKGIAVRPFKTFLIKQIYPFIPTGFPKLDAALGGGLGYRELGIIVGHSGGGKTALCTNICRGAAYQGKKVMYVSMEEEKEDIANRLYAATFNITYGSLRQGSGYMELMQKAVEMDSEQKLQIFQDNIILLDLKGKTPISATALKTLIDRTAVEENFYPDLVLIDQLQFMEPNEEFRQDQQWLREKRIVEEIDIISHEPIIDKNYSIWVLHQAKGKVKAVFTSDEIDGFKGIRHKPETVLGIGREGLTSDLFEIFSLKSRHSKNFRIRYRGDLEYMTFRELEEECAVGITGVRSSISPGPPLTTGNAGNPALNQILHNGRNN